MSEHEAEAKNPAETTGPDWDAIKREYELGQLSVREIARQVGLSDTAIRKRAKKHKWVKGTLAEQVRRKARDELVRDAAPAKVRKTNARTAENAANPGNSGDATGPQVEFVDAERDDEADEEAVEAAAQRVVEVVRSHRKDIKSARNIMGVLIAELQSVTAQRDEIEETIVAETKGDKDTKRRNAMLRAVSLPSRAQTITSLSLAMTKLVALERQAFNVDDEGGRSRNTDLPLEERLRAYQREDAINGSGGKVVRIGEKREAIDAESESNFVSRETQGGA